MFADQSILDAIDRNTEELRRKRAETPFDLISHMKDHYIISLSFSSNSLDNCTYSLVETKILLEHGQTPPEARPARDVFALYGHANACRYIFAHLHDATVTDTDVRTLHRKLQNGLENEETLGVYRTIKIESDTNRFPAAQASEIPERMNELLARTAEDITMHPVERAITFHNEIMYIQPFLTGNQKLARLAMNMLLLQKDFFPVEIPCHFQDDYFGAFAKDPMDRTALYNILARCEMEAQKSMLRFFFPDEETQRQQKKAKPRYDYSRHMQQQASGQTGQSAG